MIPKLPSSPCFDLVIRDTHSGRLVASLRLSIEAVDVHCPSMSSPSPSCVAGTDASATGVLATISPETSSIVALIDRWCAWLEARRKKPQTVEAYRQMVMRMVREMDWSKSSDLTFAGVTEWLSKHDWKGCTYNRNLSTMRSLTKFAALSGDISQDAMALAPRAVNDGREGARAATLEEARTMIRVAWYRQQSGDNRCRGDRALMYLMLFGAGCRASEPQKLLRRHLVLDGPFPIIAWTPEINKNSRYEETVIHPELAELLRRHLAAEDDARALAGKPPADLDDRVFPYMLSKSAWRADRFRGGIEPKDRRDRIFSPHAARKFFATHLAGLGIHARMIDRLMRHQVGVSGRYYDPDTAEMADSIGKFPSLWPVPVEGGQIGGRLSVVPLPARQIGEKLTTTPPVDEDTPVGSDDRASAPGGGRTSPILKGRAGGHVEPGSSGQGSVGRVDSPSIESLQCRLRDSKNEGSNDLADLLEALARVIRSGVGGHGKRQRGDGQRTGGGAA